MARAKGFYAKGVRRKVKDMLCNRLILCHDLDRLSPNILISEEVFIIN